MKVLYIILIGFPLIILTLIIYIIIRLLTNKNKGNIEYGNYALNILENNTTTSNDDDD